MDSVLLRTPIAGSDGLVTREWARYQRQLSATATAALQPANNLSDVASVAATRTNLGLGTAATQASSAFDSAGSASTAAAAAQAAAIAASDPAGSAAAAVAAIPSASAVATGLLTAADWATFNAKQAAITGASGTIVIPKLTTANGSITVVNGIITAFVNPT
jgi:hypothetical protein